MRDQKIGKFGEEIGKRYLQNKHFDILDTNFQNHKGYKHGEIDIIASKENVLIFVEVKTRIIQGNEEVFPEENITVSKLKNLEHIASTYIKEKNLWNMSYRFDALAICIDRNFSVAKVRHIENIFL